MSEKQDEKKGDLLKVYKVETPQSPAPRRRAAKIAGAIFLTSVVILLVAASIAYATTRNRILPNVTIADVRVGGLDRLAATEILQRNFDAMNDQGLKVELYGDIQTVALRATGATDPDLVYQLVDWDVATAVERALNFGQSGNQLRDFFAPLYHLVIPTQITPELTLSEIKLEQAMREAFPNAESPGTPTDFVIMETNGVLQVTVTEAVEGAMIDTKSALRQLRQDALDLQLHTLELKLIERSAIISAAQAETLIPQVITAVENAPYELVFDPEYGANLAYPISANDLKLWLLPEVDDAGNPVLTLDTQAMKPLLDRIHADIDISPRDAKFVVEGDRVVEFAESRDGFIINDDTLLADLIRAFGSIDTSVEIATERTAPAVPTGSANDLGIKEVLGVGFSSFAGSPSNRRANIRHGAEKLNGILIPPGQTLSLLERLRPFTVADGYLPELVIKGDQIIPEIGGGLCQIGTTTFRAAMNSGLEIAERRNHSLVVSYYNDPSNGNPGTDATIYDPAPDLKIQNDTNHHIMLVTEVDNTRSELHFTFWGTSDGRQGSYTPPQVLSWTGYGATINKETTSLAPGVKQCQAPHPGATTSFDYNIILPDGTTKTRTFASTYRSLPTICLVGVGGGEVQGVQDLAEDAAATETQ